MRSECEVSHSGATLIACAVDGQRRGSGGAKQTCDGAGHRETPPVTLGGIDAPGDVRVAWPPARSTSLIIGVAAVVIIGVSGWLATSPGAQSAQTGLVVWFNDPPAPLGTILAVTNPLLRPVPLVAVSAALFGWVLISAHTRRVRLEVLRATVIAVAAAEVGAQILKRVANQARPLAVISGLDSHGYPRGPAGNAYPSAHTALVVAAVAGLWPWMKRPQRVVGVVFAALVALNRLYIGAHWPLDILGGAALGMVGARPPGEVGRFHD